MNLHHRGWIATLASLLCFSQFLPLLPTCNTSKKDLEISKYSSTTPWQRAPKEWSTAQTTSPTSRTAKSTSSSAPICLDITDGQLYKMAVDRYRNMITNFRLYDFDEEDDAKPEAFPNVMAAFAFGKEIILVSSHKGKPFIDRTGKPSTILKQIQACQRIYAEQGRGPAKNHRHNARCCEMFALYHAERLHEESQIKAMTPLKMVTVERIWNQPGQPYMVKNPCSPDDNNGRPGKQLMSRKLTTVLSELAGQPHEDLTITSLDVCKGLRKRHDLDGFDTPLLDCSLGKDECERLSNVWLTRHIFWCPLRWTL